MNASSVKVVHNKDWTPIMVRDEEPFFVERWSDEETGNEYVNEYRLVFDFREGLLVEITQSLEGSKGGFSWEVILDRPQPLRDEEEVREAEGADGAGNGTPTALHNVRREIPGLNGPSGSGPTPEITGQTRRSLIIAQTSKDHEIKNPGAVTGAHFTVTLLARFLGLSISAPLSSAM
jgi:hypothetical protein